MKYLVNRETKEHREYTGSMADQQLVGTLPEEWEVIEADPEGWIKHERRKANPLPAGAMCEIKDSDGMEYDNARSSDINPWHLTDYYRPILDDKPEFDEAMLEQRTEESLKQLREKEAELEAKAREAQNELFRTLIPRLKTAHKAASELPDIIAELREVLEPMGLTVCHTSPFYAEDAEPEPDMTDWRNWKKGDLIVRMSPCNTVCFNQGDLYPVQRILDGAIVVIDAEGITHELSSFSIQGHFRFHSRPTKEQDK